MKDGVDSNTYTCKRCNSGTVAQAGDTECESCIAGLFQSESEKGTCQSCESGTWSDTVGSSSPLDCKKCVRGTYSTATAAASATTCTACPPGSKSNVFGAKKKYRV